MSESKIGNFVIRQYYCSICNVIHEIKLDKEISKGHSQFPFPYIFLHGDLKNILTTLYIDKNFEIRGVDVHVLTKEDLFSKDQATMIISTLMDEIEMLRNENEKLIKKLKKYKEKNKRY